MAFPPLDRTLSSTVHELKEYCAQVTYQVFHTLTLAVDTEKSAHAIGPLPATDQEVEEPTTGTMVPKSSIEANFGSEVAGHVILRARANFNAAWQRRFKRRLIGKPKSKVLGADETVIGAIYGPVNSEAELAFRLGSLVVLACDGGLQQDVLNMVSPVQQTADGNKELSLQHLERILLESGIPDAEALVQPLRKIKRLRNGTLPFHSPNTTAESAFAQIGHPFPVRNYTACWDDICNLYCTLRAWTRSPRHLAQTKRRDDALPQCLRYAGRLRVSLSLDARHALFDTILWTGAAVAIARL